MSLAPLALGVLAAFALAYLLYGRFLARHFRLDPRAATPAHEQRDGQDYEPAGRFYLLSQHFSAISAAGPIAGPILATQAFGWQPAILWIVLGCVFIGAMHDLTALVGSVAHRGRSVAEILRAHLNPRTYAAFSLYIWLALVYVITAFTDMTARAFVEDLDLALPRGPGLSIAGAGVASSSVLYLGLGLAMGLVRRHLALSIGACTAVFVPLVALAIWVGPRLPLAIVAPGANPALWWAWIVLAYCGLASILPVWMLLQPRGYLGGFFLYVTLIGGLLGLLIQNPSIEVDAFHGWSSAAGQPLVPFLFITIACGACSGFHGLVCSGTTSKQIDRQSDSLTVGYGGMLLEGVVATLAVCCAMLAAGSAGAGVERLGADKVFGYGVGTFLTSLGLPLQFAVSFGMLAFATFVYDTLDVCTRLARHLFQEFTGWKGTIAAATGTVLTLALPAYFVAQTATDAAGRAIPAYKLIWPLFGTSNQLLAALTLVSLFLWLVRTRKSRVLRLAVGVPMVFMLGMTLWALWLQVRAPGADPLLVGIGWVLLALAVWVTAEALAAVVRPARQQASGG